MTFEEMQLLLQSIVVAQRETNATVKEITAGLQETKKVVDSNSRAIQAILDQAATDRLKHEQRMERMERLSEGLVNMLSSIDEDRPTILRNDS
jgi:hypothetical protein